MPASDNDQPNGEATPADAFHAKPVPPDAIEKLTGVASEPGVDGPYEVPEEHRGSIGFTHFDAPNSEDNTITVLLAKENMGRLPMQSLVRIRCSKDEADPYGKARAYLGVVVAGPFAEPDGLRADASLVVSTTVRGHGQVFLPRYHGRAFVQILGEEVAPTRTVPPRYRPTPNSPVFPLNDAETEAVYKAEGDARLGTVIGHESIVVGIPTDKKSVLPRHTGILGTTGGGKSTTVARLIHQLQQSGVAVVLFDVEGEYTEIDQPADNAAMLAALADRRQQPQGVANLRVHHLVGKETSRQASPSLASPFRLDFSDLSPYAVMEILELPDAQQTRFLKAYDVLKQLMKELQIFPRPHNDQDYQRLLDLDEADAGYPEMTLAMLRDVVNVCLDYADRGEGTARRSRKKDEEGEDEFELSRPLYSHQLKDHGSRIKQAIARSRPPGHLPSWMSLLGKLNRLARLGVFDSPKAKTISPASLTRPGHVSVIDLSDTDAPAVNNLVIATLLRQLQQQQEANFRQAEADGKHPTPVVVIIEEAHEFLSDQRIKQMPVLFQQVARIAKRGRKRWLGLCFVTQLPQHLPDEVLGLLNNFVLHKISDGGVIDRLRKSISGLDRGQWGMLPALAPGQAVVSLSSMSRPLLVSVDPAPCRLRLVD